MTHTVENVVRLSLTSSGYEMKNKEYKLFLKAAISIKAAYESGDLLGSQPHIAEMFSNPDELIILTEEEFSNKPKGFRNKWVK